MVDVTVNGARLSVRGSGAVFWAEARCLIVSDLHLGKSERMARRGGAMLPPYEIRDTLARLSRDVAEAAPVRVICLGDSLDDGAALAGLGADEIAMLSEMQEGRDWIWIAGNHDPAPDGLGGHVAPEMVLGPLTFRHIAVAAAENELSGHYHPKARLSVRGKSVSRPCLLHDTRRAILPAYGTYTGGLDWTSPVFADLLQPGACAVLTGRVPHSFPMPQRTRV